MRVTQLLAYNACGSPVGFSPLGFSPKFNASIIMLDIISSPVHLWSINKYIDL